MLIFIKCLVLLLMAGTIGQSVTGECPEIQNCDTCNNPELQCKECEEGKLLSEDGESCNACPTGCKSCTRKINGDVDCNTCLDGYSLGQDSSICISCGSNCNDCDSNGNCKMCEDHFVFENGECKGCPGNCETCTDSSTCSKCKEGFYETTVDQVTSCAACVDNCIECDSSDCTKCSDGYLRNTLGECVACPWKCTNCISDEEAEAGNIQINPNIADKTKICNTNGCEDGYGNKQHDSCDPCPEHCLSCNSTDCKSCDKGYAISPNADGTFGCSICLSNCEECVYDQVDKIMKCVTCAELHALNPDNGQCQACDANCLGGCRWEAILEYAPVMTYTPVDISIDGPVCGECTVGFGVSQRGSCEACPDNCHGCYDDTDDSTTPDMVCGYTCILHYDCGDDLLCQFYRQENRDSPNPDRKYDFSDSITKAMPYDVFVKNTPRKKRAVVLDNDESSETSNFGMCCHSGYYNTAHGQDCTQCDSNCRYCTANGGCTLCDYGYDYEGTTCTIKCPENCHTCSSSSECSECDPILRINAVGNTHYVELYPHDYACYTCPINCEASINTPKHCEYNTALDTAVCKSSEFCRAGTSLTPDGNCHECQNKDCKKCQWIIEGGAFTSYCVDCNDLFAPDNERECRNCPEHCLECMFNAGEVRTDCKEGRCEEGFVRDPTEGTCITCGTGCTSCEFTNGVKKCEECGAGYVIHPNDDTCIACPEFCSKCEYDGNNQLKCSGSQYCTSGYSLDVGGLCKACPRNCEKCHGHESGVMYAEYCHPYFYRNQEQCGACPGGCESCTDHEGTMQCAECSEGQVLSPRLKTCLKCPSNCKNCTESNGEAKCNECKENYHHIDGQCIGCSELYFANCAECTPNGGKCTKCIDGYTLAEDGDSCTSCATGISGCFECVDLEAECTSCSDGLARLSNGQCGYNCYSCNATDGCISPNQNSSDVDLVPCASHDHQCASRIRTTSDESFYVERLCLEILACPSEAECQDRGTYEECIECCEGELCNVRESISGSNILLAGLGLVYVMAAAVLIQ